MGTMNFDGIDMCQSCELWHHWQLRMTAKEDNNKTNKPRKLTNNKSDKQSKYSSVFELKNKDS